MTLGLTLTACGSAEFQRTMGVPVQAECADAFLIPDGAITVNLEDELHEQFELAQRRSYSRFLGELGEPSLWCDAQPDESYRLVLAPTWVNPLAIRVSRTGQRITLRAVSLSGAGGFETGGINRSFTRQLSMSQWNELKRAIEELHFWRMTTTERDTFGNDGSVWYIEAQREGRYHLVARWTDRDGVRGVGQKFIELAGLTGDFGQVY